MVTIPKQVTVKTVDMNGFLGRDNHPTPEDRGTVLTVDRIEIIRLEDSSEDYTEVVFYCRRPNGSPVEMMDFEVVAL